MSNESAWGGAAPSLEWRVLLACLRIDNAESDRSDLERELSNADLDGERLVACAIQHDLAPLVYFNVHGLGRSHHLPWLDQLKAALAANALRNVVLFMELTKVLEFAKAERIPVVVLKGAALAENAYRNRALRAMRDVDLMIRSEHLFKLEQFLGSLGYRRGEVQEPTRSSHADNPYHFGYTKRVAGMPHHCFELHWHLDYLARPFRIDLEGLWERAVPTRVAGIQTTVLCPEDSLLHLCLHTCKHKLVSGVRALCDIAAVVRHHGAVVDWPQFTSRAWQWRVNPLVYVPLRLAQELLGARVPSTVLNELVPEAFDSRVVDAARVEILEDKRSTSRFHTFCKLRSRRSFGERARIVTNLFSTDVMAGRYSLRPGSKQVYWHYPRRFTYLVTNYAPELWRFLRRSRQVVEQAERKSQIAEWLSPFQ